MTHKHKWKFSRTERRAYLGSPPRRLEFWNVFVCECGKVKKIKEK